MYCVLIAISPFFQEDVHLFAPRPKSPPPQATSAHPAPVTVSLPTYLPVGM